MSHELVKLKGEITGNERSKWTEIRIARVDFKTLGTHG